MAIRGDLNADMIAEEVGMSKASLYKKVNNHQPDSAWTDQQYRLKKAADLLKTSTLSVSEVILETG